MDNQLTEIGQQLRRICNANGLPVLQTGKVVSVDEAQGTCIVKMTIDITDGDGGGNETDGVLLNTVSVNNNGLMLYPATGSDVVVGEVDGPGFYCVVKCSDLLKMVVTIGGTTMAIQDGLIQFNGGSFGGLTKTLELQMQINKLNTLVSHLIAIINGAPIPEAGSGANSALQIALKTAIASDSVGDFSNIEDTNVKH